MCDSNVNELLNSLLNYSSSLLDPIPLLLTVHDVNEGQGSNSLTMVLENFLKQEISNLTINGVARFGEDSSANV